jgi:hypothetical protein
LASFGLNEAALASGLAQARPAPQIWNTGEMTVERGNPRLPAGFSPDFKYRRVSAINRFAYRK